MGGALEDVVVPKVVAAVVEVLNDALVVDDGCHGVEVIKGPVLGNVSVVVIGTVGRVE